MNPSTNPELVPAQLPCPVYRKCNGCQLQNLTYEEQLRLKENKIKKLFGKLCPVAPIIGMDKPFYYRNKAQAVYRMTKDKKLLSGIYQSDRKGIVAFDKCLTADPLASKIFVTIRQIMEKYHIKPYEESSGTGFLKHVLIRTGKMTGEVLVVLVSSTLDFPAKEKFLQRLLSAHPQITSVVLNVNPHPTKLLLGKEQAVLYGNGTIRDVLCGCTFQISPRSFYQINHDQTEVLYHHAIGLAGLTGKEVILDAYCGIGTIGLIAAPHCKKVLAVESNQQAIRDASQNAEINQVTNVRFSAADAGEYMAALAETEQKVDAVFLDPPRAGCDRKFLTSLVKLAPEKVVYISCNPETQLRDCKYLLKNGYRIEGDCQPVDLFPHTVHIENVLLLMKNENL